MSLPPNGGLLEKHLNPVWFETGCYDGNSLLEAHRAGFKDIRGLESDADKVQYCRVRHKGRPITIYHGDSATDLWLHIQEITTPITFFLDAHWNFFENTPQGPNPFPLLDELKQIEQHPIKTHTIIIDDWHIFYEDQAGYSKMDVKAALQRINRNYIFTPVSNPVVAGILVAHLGEREPVIFNEESD